MNNILLNQRVSRISLKK